MEYLNQGAAELTIAVFGGEKGSGAPDRAGNPTAGAKHARPQTLMHKFDDLLCAQPDARPSAMMAPVLVPANRF